MFEVHIIFGLGENLKLLVLRMAAETSNACAAGNGMLFSYMLYCSCRLKGGA